MGRTKLNNPSTIQRLTARRLEILTLCARYRYLDIKHLLALLGDHNSKDYLRIKALKDTGLLNYLPNPTFKRDTLTASQVLEITQAGKEQLSQRHVEIHPVTWLAAGTYKEPVHNLNLCLALASIEIALRNAFIPWGMIESKAPTLDRKLYSFKIGNHLVVPDAMFSVEYRNHFACFAVELDMTNHGKAEYRAKYQRYEDLIFGGLYRAQLGMTQKLYVLTITTNEIRKNNIIDALPPKTSPFLFKVIQQYGLFDKPPAPTLDILDGWERDGQRVNLKGGDWFGHRSHPRTARPT